MSVPESPREVEVETSKGTLEVNLWEDRWVLAYWQRDGERVEAFDTFARTAGDLVPSLVRVGLPEPESSELSERLIALRTAMDAAQ